jgi:uncharacterized protein
VKAVWIACGLVLTGIALVGVVLPGLPTTIFALGAAACFARSSPRLEAWLLSHGWLGPLIRAWRNERAIPTPAKLVAVVSMAASGIWVALTAPVGVAVGVWIALVASGSYVVSRPAPSKQIA